MSAASEPLNHALEMLYDTALSLNILQTIMATPDQIVIFDPEDLAAMLRLSRHNIEAVCDALDPPNKQAV